MKTKSTRLFRTLTGLIVSGAVGLGLLAPLSESRTRYVSEGGMERRRHVLGGRVPVEPLREARRT